MLNSKPNNDKYHNGNYIPKNRDKVVKLNSEGGIYYRSSWEKKIMIYLDLNENIIKWGAETLAIPYQMTHFEKGDLKVKGHCYYPDFYYEIKSKDGTIKTVVAEVKPKSEYNDVLLFEKKLFEIPNDASIKKLKNIEYKFKMAQKNSDKWQTMIKYCQKKGWDFIIITEDHLKRFNL